MKPGKEYEQFIYETFKDFFVDCEVKPNDKILGIKSGIKREIDVSLRGKYEGKDILYITQAKDHNRPADVKIIGEFSSVIIDVGATGGFLVCASGFAKTIHTYAKSLGIELITVADINSKKWHIDLEVPVELIRYEVFVKFSTAFTATQELIDSGHDLSQISLSLDGGKSFGDPFTQVNLMLHKDKVDITTVDELTFVPPQVQMRLPTIPFLIKSFKITFKCTPRNFLKFVKPDEYKGMRDHLENEEIPTKITLPTMSLDVDDTWVDMTGKEMPVMPIKVWPVFTVKPDLSGQIVSSKTTLKDLGPTKA